MINTSINPSTYKWSPPKYRLNQEVSFLDRWGHTVTGIVSDVATHYEYETHSAFHVYGVRRERTTGIKTGHWRHWQVDEKDIISGNFGLLEVVVGLDPAASAGLPDYSSLCALCPFCSKINDATNMLTYCKHNVRTERPTFFVFRQEPFNWRDLLVTADDGEDCGELGTHITECTPLYDDVQLYDDGALICMPCFFINAPGEQVIDDMPRIAVDWTGFREALEEARANKAKQSDA